MRCASRPRMLDWTETGAVRGRPWTRLSPVPPEQVAEDDDVALHEPRGELGIDVGVEGGAFRGPADRP